MKSLRNRMLVITAVALAVVCASAVPASAQLVCKGSFTLSQEVHWQTATLPPGDYTFEMQSPSSGSRPSAELSATLCQSPAKKLKWLRLRLQESISSSP